MDAVDVVELAHLTDVTPHRLLAAWHAREWGHLYADWDEERALEELLAMDRPGEVPLTLCAFDAGRRDTAHLLGSVSLLDDDELPGWEAVGPWLASLFVRPEARGRGVGRRLVDEALRTAGQLGIDAVHLFTDDQEAWYLARGWRTVARTDANGHRVAVMLRRTDPWAARRSVVSTWTTDPDTAGAYSYLRVGATPAARHRLTEEVAPGLWLAGEATAADAPGTLHGAWRSGERAAAQVLAAGGAGTVLVVGAGLAGLAAATALQAGGRSVLVVEAKDTPGGRARTDTSLGGPVHLGGAWLHGTDGHPLVACGLTGTPGTWDDVATFVVGHGRVRRPDLAEREAEVHHQVAEARRALPPGTDRSVAGVVEAALAGLGEGLDAAVVSGWVRAEFENLYAAPMGDLSLRSGDEPFRLPGPDVLLSTPIQPVVDRLAAEVPLRTGARVLTLRRSSDAWHAELDGGEVLAAVQVVVTVPVGALGQGRPAFRPPLAADVVAALGQVGAGPVAKAFFTFDEAFWAPYRAFFTLAVPATGAAARGPGGDGDRLPFELWVDVSELAGRPVLCAFATGAAAAVVEGMDEHTRCLEADRCLAPLRAEAAPAVSP